MGEDEGPLNLSNGEGQHEEVVMKIVAAQLQDILPVKYLSLLSMLLSLLLSLMWLSVRLLPLLRFCSPCLCVLWFRNGVLQEGGGLTGTEIPGYPGVGG